ncbi:hypothetical protein TWF788_004520 [Orbilia oligospora]|uniref:Protein kinase domain-containing protein n=1 Tax=Orbilia oligospora TaxID=2813651 RepID=A0A7C8KAK8_ORBOL|nr:hypothetical protein TWF788_004520 [Orbilia oligospora]
MSLTYHRLGYLQRGYIPRLFIHGKHRRYGFGIQVLEDCGETLENGWHPGTKKLARIALAKIHEGGVLHRDISLRNINYDLQNTLFPLRIVDLGEATLDTELVTGEAMQPELKQLEELRPIA